MTAQVLKPDGLNLDAPPLEALKRGCPADQFCRFHESKTIGASEVQGSNTDSGSVTESDTDRFSVHQQKVYSADDPKPFKKVFDDLLREKAAEAMKEVTLTEGNSDSGNPKTSFDDLLERLEETAAGDHDRYSDQIKSNLNEIKASLAHWGPGGEYGMDLTSYTKQ